MVEYLLLVAWRITDDKVSAINTELYINAPRIIPCNAFVKKINELICFIPYYDINKIILISNNEC
jgi:hypothetical protein